MKTITTITLLILSMCVCACQPTQSADDKSEIEYLNMPGIDGSGLPFSSAVRVDNTLYLSGMIGLEPGTMRPVPGGIEAEAKQLMQDIKATLEAFGSSMDRVAKCTVFLADEADREAFNAIYMSHFDKLPARSGVTVKGLALGARVEVDCIAVVD